VESYLLLLLNAFVTLYSDNVFFCFRSVRFLFEFEIASLWLLSETVFCYGTVFMKYFNHFKYICTACSAKLMHVLPCMFWSSVISKSRSAGLIRLNSYRLHSKSKMVLKLCFLSVPPYSGCTAKGKNTFWDYGCDFFYFVAFRQSVTD
jgi:hypothetical protein